MMRSTFVLAIAALLTVGCSHSALQHEAALQGQIGQTDVLHRPLPLDTVHSLEALSRQAKVLSQRVIADELTLHVPTTTGIRPVGSPDDPDYAIFGTVDTVLAMHGEDLSQYTRLAFDVYPQMNGSGIANLNVQLGNATPAQVGAHLVNLVPGRWNSVCYDLGLLPREEVRSLRIYTDIKGRQPLTGADSIHYTVRGLRLEQTDHPAMEKGWEPEEDEIAYSMSGYLADDGKVAVLNARHTGKTFQLVDAATGRVRHKGKVMPSKVDGVALGSADFTALSTPGLYRLQVDGLCTEAFPIGPDVFLPSSWRVLNYIFCQRCGCKVEGIHDACHSDLYADHNGQSFSYGGGWHDAGDLSQQTLQTADVAFALLEASQRYAGKDDALSHRLAEEACWGLKFVLQCRMGDGYHASSLGLLHWTDNKPGTADDIHTVRKQNHAFDNFLYSAYEAYACRVLGKGHPLYSQLCEAACEDYRFACQQYEEQGILPYPHIMEHTFNTSPSLFTATASWASTQLFLLTGDDAYAGKASRFIRHTLSCQETEGSRPELKGFFYRDESRRSIVHFIHQSREQIFAQALVSLCQSQPGSPEAPRWQAAIRLYADYLRSLMPYTGPYGMASSGTYLASEPRDEEGFRSLHIFAPEDAAQLYTRQLTEGGVRLDSTHYVKRFPVWFNIFNGNEAIILSTGKAAALMARHLGDNRLRNYALSQLYWTVGRNPFCQSLIYGEGHSYPSMDSFSSGEITGEIPVGIRSWSDTDTPFWPRTNNACYKEVWLTSAGKWLSLVSEF